ncbi:MAG: hypothetical protein JWM78_518 [Verrucomicrobiaceae bacterium]|nr:hypothetical protein [Verrucomicrobiaceae bacterium]
MLLMIVLLLIAAALAAILAFATVNIRRRQRQLVDKKEASQLQRRADHLFKIALATQVHTRQNGIARALLQDAIQVLEHSALLDPELPATPASLRECHALLASTEQDDPLASAGRDAVLEFPETELIEAQLHLTEASRLLAGLDKRGLIAYDQLQPMLTDLKHAQRALELRLQLRRAAASPQMERTVEQVGEYLQGDRDRTKLSR